MGPDPCPNRADLSNLRYFTGVHRGTDADDRVLQELAAEDENADVAHADEPDGEPTLLFLGFRLPGIDYFL